MLQVVLHLLAILAVTLSAIPSWLVFFLALSILMSLIYVIKGHSQPSMEQVRRLTYHVEKGWKLFNEEGCFDNVKLLSSTVSTRLCLFMHFECDDGERYNVIIFRDALPFELFRQLRVRLKILG